MLQIKKSTIQNLCLLYLALPVTLFLTFWCRVFVAVPALLLLIILFLYSYNKEKSSTLFQLSYKYLFLIIVILMIWCVLGGQGNLYYQSSDWGARNDIFRNMIFKDSPVFFENQSFLSYYIGHWLVPTYLAKLFLLFGISNEIVWRIANILLLFWTCFGVTLSYFSVASLTNMRKKWHWFLILLIFIFFSGMDIVGLLIRNSDFSMHLETWNIYYQFSSQTTQLFWVFNQAIPAWIATALLIGTENIRNDAVYGVLLILFSPLPLIGCFFIVLAKIISQYILSKKFKELIIDLFSLQNIAAFLLSPILLSYMFSNGRSGGGNGLLFNLNLGGTTLYSWFMLLVFIFVEFGVYLFFVYKKQKKNYLFYAITVCLPFIAAFRYGTSNDFEMRASIPFLFCLMILLIQELYDHVKINKYIIHLSIKGLLLSFCLLLGAITPLTEFYRGIYEIRKENKIMLTKEDVKIDSTSINFVSENYDQSLFGKYFGK